ncbi:MAG: beta-ketoacyl synthase [Cellvibrionales bacterium TMED49]|nr:beta-ketoacyl synthase [Porticoccaceae bacterium]OUU38465.1 MAG: beta-ketoacyl synthase [Cellvibrionales bacterium TMED49]
MGSALPVIVGFGGYNAAGRSSSFQSYRRMVFDSLSVKEQQQTIVGLACLMGVVCKEKHAYVTPTGHELSACEVDNQFRTVILAGTLVRKTTLFDPAAIRGNRRISFAETKDGRQIFTILRRDMPRNPPSEWQIEDVIGGRVRITTNNLQDFLVECDYELVSKASGQLPEGFELSRHYNSRFHPRGLQMALLGCSDALHSTGLDWQRIVSSVCPDQIGVYSSSALSQITEDGFGGLMQNRLRGKRTTNKQVALGLNTMPADFINAYILGSVGHTEAVTGACATFLYVLQAALRDIRSGRRRVAIVGNAEAGISPEISEGFANMGALADDETLCKIDGSSTPDYRRASRPFAENCGFVLAESTQYVVLMDDSLAIELGADIYGAVTNVFINADGVKKSISAPGIGNYLSFSQAVAAAIAVVGEDTVKHKSFVQAHGSSTPANRVTESDLIQRVAEVFDIHDWPVSAAKAYVGHSLSAASGDQLVSALGTFKYDIVPGIKTIQNIAPDVAQERAIFPIDDMDVSGRQMDVAFINAKGFGGNNATATVLSPQVVNKMLQRRHSKVFDAYLSRRDHVTSAATEYAKRADAGQLGVIYRYGEPLLDEEDISIDRNGITISGFHQPVSFESENPWTDMTD